MSISKTLLATVIASGTLAAAAAPATAGCSSCYQPQVYAPPVQYRQMVAPARYGVVERTVMVAPARRVYHRIPAQYGTVQKTVLVSPQRVSWQQVCDACGNVGYRQHVVPAQYGVVERTVMTAPPRVVAEVIPAQYRTVQQTVMVAPAQAYLVRVHGCNTCGY